MSDSPEIDSREIRPASADLTLLQRLCRHEVDADALVSRALASPRRFACWTGPGGMCGARLIGGRAARVWLAPENPDDSAESIGLAAKLLTAAHRWLDEQGVVWRQMLMPPGDHRSSAAAAAGYRRQTTVHQMELSFDSLQQALAAAETDDAHQAAEADVLATPPQQELELFRGTLAESFDAAGATPRPAEDLWSGLIAAAVRPRLLRLDERRRPLGCLLLDAPHSGCWTVLYLGIVPSARRRGRGRRLLRAAVSLAAKRLAEGLSLSVSAGNAPALALYDACGFVRGPTWELWSGQ